jgi:2-polyprenyl-3-methyl-5-hydroxy-6-metoxy-1,4-benzoquinol methylase
LLLELIRYVRASVYELPEDLGRFDVIICGSLLHLSDPLAALQRIHRLCVGRAIVSTGCTNDSETNSRPICEFVGQKATDGNYWTYWSLSAEALRRMLLAAGFVRVENEKHFTLQMQESPRDFWAIPHVVMTAVAVA